MTSEWMYPYTSYYGSTGNCSRQKEAVKTVTIEDYRKLETNTHPRNIMHALVHQGPLIVTVQADTWFDYGGGIADPCTNMSNIDLDHAVQLVGYGAENGTDYWLVRNSWDVTWGEAGYIRLKRSSSIECGLDVTPADGVACEDNMPAQQKVCGTCGILFDVTYPVGAKVVGSPSGDINR